MYVKLDCKGYPLPRLYAISSKHIFVRTTKYIREIQKEDRAEIYIVLYLMYVEIRYTIGVSTIRSTCYQKDV